VKKSFSYIISFNCAKNLQTTGYILEYAARSPETLIVCLQEPDPEYNGLPPHHDTFTRYTPCPKAKCVTYIRSQKSIQASLVFSHGVSFMGCKISLQKNQLFVIYNIYSDGGMVI
jgi:hypothetical protein